MNHRERYNKIKGGAHTENITAMVQEVEKKHVQELSSYLRIVCIRVGPP